ncbi:MAG: hypothetical protein KGZ58_13945 [Ignavibacteriales bacterium]|nr:hypothetical protein [Ignavibacteriales bacterium]
MKLSKGTIEKLANVCIHIGEATLIGSGATFLTVKISIVISALGLLIGIFSIWLGLHINNLNDKER